LLTFCAEQEELCGKLQVGVAVLCHKFQITLLVNVEYNVRWIRFKFFTACSHHLINFKFNSKFCTDYCRPLSEMTGLQA